MHREGPLLREIVKGVAPATQAFPFGVRAIRSLKTLRLASRVTFFIGENGSGKSTLLEAIALAAGLSYEGGSRNFRPLARPAHQGESQEELVGKLADALTLRWRKKPHDAFFLRAESFTNVVAYLEDHDEDLKAFASYGGVSLNRRSHGESFLDLLVHRFSGGGLYLIDEPEAALSAARQLALLVRMHDLLAQHPDTQFIIATHSPIVLAFPGAQIYAFDRGAIRAVPYKDTDPYIITRRFLENPERGLREAFGRDPTAADP
jgi:predicted ATPase